jgi:predicted membrane channel-forming protein YqfA (hemolysin III family)
MNIAAIISSIVIITGCFLPWVQMGALINNKGINNSDAIIILAASIVSLVISIATKRKWALLNLLLGLICGFVAVINYRDLTKRVDASQPKEDLFSLSLSMGSGLYVVLIGSALLIIVSIIDVISGYKKNKLEKSQNAVNKQ